MKLYFFYFASIAGYSSCLVANCSHCQQEYHKVSLAEICNLAEKSITCDTNPYLNLEVFLGKVNQWTQCLPSDILTALADFKLHKTKDAYLYFKGFPTDNQLPPTPSSELSFPPPAKYTFVSEFVLALFGCYFGEPFNYIQEENGNIFRNIRPTESAAFEQTSSGSKATLELHTETAFHPFKPDYLLLYCLRTDRSGKAFTTVASIKDVINTLSDSAINELLKQQFRTGIDVSFGNKDKTQSSDEIISVLQQDGNDWTIVYDLDLMISLTDAGKYALQSLQAGIVSVQQCIFLEPGDLLIVDNRRAIHGRTAYTPLFDGYDRWLQRMYISTSESFKKEIALKGRIIKTTF